MLEEPVVILEFWRLLEIVEENYGVNYSIDCRYNIETGKLVTESPKINTSGGNTGDPR